MTTKKFQGIAAIVVASLFSMSLQGQTDTISIIPRQDESVERWEDSLLQFMRDHPFIQEKKVIQQTAHFASIPISYSSLAFEVTIGDRYVMIITYGEEYSELLSPVNGGTVEVVIGTDRYSIPKEYGFVHYPALGQIRCYSPTPFETETESTMKFLMWNEKKVTALRLIPQK